jgi:hypothetical protein
MQKCGETLARMTRHDKSAVGLFAWNVAIEIWEFRVTMTESSAE